MIGWTPYSGVVSLTFGNGIVETFTRDTDDRITGVVANTASSAAVVNRTLAWTGETLDSIADNQFPGNTPPFTYSAQSQRLTTPPARLTIVAGGMTRILTTAVSIIILNRIHFEPV